MLSTRSLVFVAFSALAAAGPIFRTVDQLDEAAFAEAQQRDETATRAFTNAYLQTADGRCVFVDELSGDNRANLTPLQVAQCKATTGQGWDVITAGTHNNVNGSALIVSALTNACVTFDPRRDNGSQVMAFSCGGRADGSGQVSDSQLFAFNKNSLQLQLSPGNQEGSCLAVSGNVLGIADCNSRDSAQIFRFAGTASDDDGAATVPSGSPSATASTASATATATAPATVPSNGTASATGVTSATATATPSADQNIRETVTVTATVTEKPDATTVFVTVNPATEAKAAKTSSTTTIYVTVGNGFEGATSTASDGPAQTGVVGSILDLLESLLGNN